LDITIHSLVNRASVKKLVVTVKSWRGRILVDDFPVRNGSLKVDLGADSAKLDGKFSVKF